MALLLPSTPPLTLENAALMGATSDHADEGKTPGMAGALTVSRSTAGLQPRLLWERDKHLPCLVAVILSLSHAAQPMSQLRNHLN